MKKVDYEETKMTASIWLNQQLKESLNILKNTCIELYKNYEVEGACFYGSRV